MATTTSLSSATVAKPVNTFKSGKSSRAAMHVQKSVLAVAPTMSMRSVGTKAVGATSVTNHFLQAAPKIHSNNSMGTQNSFKFGKVNNVYQNLQSFSAKSKMPA